MRRRLFQGRYVLRIFEAVLSIWLVLSIFALTFAFSCRDVDDGSGRSITARSMTPTVYSSWRGNATAAAAARTTTPGRRSTTWRRS